MKLTQQILLGVAGCIALTLLLSYGLSMAVNYGVAQFEQRSGEFLPSHKGETSQTP